jgi:hypothetical protein
MGKQVMGESQGDAHRKPSGYLAYDSNAITFHCLPLRL